MSSKLISKLFVLMYPLLVLYFLYTIKLLKPIDLQNIHSNRVLVEYQACTCPDFRVVEGHKALAEHLQNPSIHTKELDVINFPAIDYDYTKQLIIEGTVVATKKDTAGKVYPVFEIID